MSLIPKDLETADFAPDYRVVVIYGIAGVGKSTLTNELRAIGLKPLIIEVGEREDSIGRKGQLVKRFGQIKTREEAINAHKSLIDLSKELYAYKGNDIDTVVIDSLSGLIDIIKAELTISNFTIGGGLRDLRSAHGESQNAISELYSLFSDLPRFNKLIKNVVIIAHADPAKEIGTGPDEKRSVHALDLSSGIAKALKRKMPFIIPIIYQFSMLTPEQVKQGVRPQRYRCAFLEPHIDYENRVPEGIIKQKSYKIDTKEQAHAFLKLVFKTEKETVNQSQEGGTKDAE